MIRRLDRGAARITSATPAIAPDAANSSSAAVLLFLAFACGVSLALLALAAMPPWALPRQVSLALYDHRQTLALSGIVIVASVGVAILIAGVTS